MHPPRTSATPDPPPPSSYPPQAKHVHHGRLRATTAVCCASRPQPALPPPTFQPPPFPLSALLSPPAPATQPLKKVAVHSPLPHALLPPPSALRQSPHSPPSLPHNPPPPPPPLPMTLLAGVRSAQGNGCRASDNGRLLGYNRVCLRNTPNRSKKHMNEYEKKGIKKTAMLPYLSDMMQE
eukprot:TRINITY_DN2981_c0_g1_i4.p1 TRINITY_DN2981_c0_g1~~TRINITY_DN2981_c0_g1_i4.p1  ORF type:complete len:201 (+),score=17.73 TRINITY_DN2981_c0_g1_i4:65-604(+)